MDVRPFLGLGGWAPFQVERTQTETRVRVFWRRCFVWLLVLAVAGWMALVAGAYFFVKYQRGFTEVSYRQILVYPFDPTDYRRAKGEFFIEQGKALLAEQDYLKAFHALRAGLAQVPEDNEARLFVVEVFHLVGRADLAAETLIEGLGTNAGSADYCRRVFSYLFQQHRDDRAVEVAREVLARGELDRQGRQLVGLALATAHFNRGRYAEARAALTEGGLTGSRPGALLTARMHWEQERRDEALKLLAALSARWPEDAEIHGDYVNCLREAGRFEDWRLLGVARRLSAPDKPAGYVAELSALAAAGRAEELDGLERAALAAFGDDAEALKLLAGYAAQAGRGEFAERLYERCREAGQGWELAATAWVEARVVANEPQAALAAIRRVAADNPAWTGLDALGGLRAVAAHAAGEWSEAALVLDAYLQSPGLRAEVLLPVAERLRLLGAHDVERRVLARAVALSPLNREALSRLIEWDLDHGVGDSLYPEVEHLLTLRKPPAALLKRMRLELQSDRYLLFSERDRVLALL